MPDPAVLLWILLPAAALAWAAVHDARTREVPDACWAVLIATGTAMRVVCSGDADPMPLAASVAGTALLAAYMLSPRLVGCAGGLVVASALILFAASYLADPGSPRAVSGLTAPAMFLIFLVMYRAGVLAGGADAKCLMSVAMVFPWYPVTDGVPALWAPAYPEALVLNPSVSVLLLALVLSAAWGLGAAVRNLRRGEVSRRMFHSYRMTIGEARTAHVWPMERASGGAAAYGRCGTDEKGEVLDGLEAAGRSDVLVTPMIPFVVPAALAFVATMLLGSPFLALVTGRC